MGGYDVGYGNTSQETTGALRGSPIHPPCQIAAEVLWLIFWLLLELAQPEHSQQTK